MRLTESAIRNRFHELLHAGHELSRVAQGDASERERADWIAWMFSAVNLLSIVLPSGQRHRVEAERLAPAADSRLSTFDLNTLLGILRSAYVEWNQGFIASLEDHFMGAAFEDFLKQAARFNDDNRTMEGAVLACAVLEDTIKRMCTRASIATDGRSLDERVNALKSSSILTKVKAERLRSYVTIRNRAFHADWAGIDQQDLRHMIEGLEEIIESHLRADA